MATSDAVKRAKFRQVRQGVYEVHFGWTARQVSRESVSYDRRLLGDRVATRDPGGLVVVELGAVEWLVLCTAGLAGGFVNTLAGGGSLLMLPALVWVGLPADIANGTNRVGVVLQSLAAARTFDRGRALDRMALRRLLPPVLIGAAFGAWAATWLDAATLEPIILVLMVLAAGMMAWRPAALVPVVNSQATPSTQGAWPMLAMGAAGFYGGFIQAGVGFVLLAILGGLLRYDLVRANALKVSVVLVLSLVALLIFITHGLVAWLPGLVLGVCGALGAMIAARLAISRGSRLIRVVLLVAVVAECIAVACR